MTIAFVGLGLIGGSLAISLRSRHFATRLIGVDNNKEHGIIALEMGLVDEILTLEQATQEADLVVLAIPVNAAGRLLPQILDSMKPEAVVVDMGSTKAGICTAIHHHPRRNQFVASHPMAGTEYSGPEAAIEGLFDGKKAIICEQHLSADFALNKVLRMYRLLNMEVLFYSDAQAHDKHVAYVSHISHVSAFMLGLTVLEIEKSESHILDLAGTGFASTVRLAKSSPSTWAPIFAQNKANVSQALQTYIDNLQKFKEYIDNGNTEGMTAMMTEANEIRKILQ